MEPYARPGHAPVTSGTIKPKGVNGVNGVNGVRVGILAPLEVRDAAG